MSNTIALAWLLSLMSKGWLCSIVERRIAADRVVHHHWLALSLHKLLLHLKLLELWFLHVVLRLEVLQVRHGLEGIVGLGYLSRPDRLVLGHLHLCHCERRRCLKRLVLLLVRELRLTTSMHIWSVYWCSHVLFTGSHCLLTDGTITRFAPERPIELGWIGKRLHVCVLMSGYWGVSLRNPCVVNSTTSNRRIHLVILLSRCTISHASPIELRLALHGHSFENVKLSRLVFHRPRTIDKLHLLVQ